MELENGTVAEQFFTNSQNFVLGESLCDAVVYLCLSIVIKEFENF